MTTILSFILFFGFNNNIPPGTIKIKNYYVDKTEISNIHWMEFLYYQQSELDSIEYKKLLPDSSNFWYTYLTNRDKPIVLISYDQAMAYCRWRSKAVSEFYNVKVIYRLPTPDEWKEIAEETLKSDLKEIRKEIDETKKAMRKEPGQYFVREVAKPEARLYHLFNNVTEMTAEKGIAMGGSNFDQTDLETNLTRLMLYKGPNIYLGFRCVAEWVSTDSINGN
jgi:formylglycine-generating enzyme required for sulfatase activity